MASPFIYPAGTAARPHAPLSVGAAYSYDAHGNMLSNGTNVLTWDEANRLAQHKVSSGASPVTFKYGPDGARARKTSQFASTIYPSTDAEINANAALAGGSVAAGTAYHGSGAYTRYPHMLVPAADRRTGLNRQLSFRQLCYMTNARRSRRIGISTPCADLCSSAAMPAGNEKHVKFGSVPDFVPRRLCNPRTNPVDNRKSRPRPVLRRRRASSKVFHG